jgi:hypothetical protein
MGGNLGHKEQLDTRARRGMDGKNLEHRVDLHFVRGTAIEKEVCGAQGVPQGCKTGELFRVAEIPSEDDNSPASIAGKQFLKVPGSGIRLVRGLEPMHSYFDSDSYGKVLFSYHMITRLRCRRYTVKGTYLGYFNVLCCRCLEDDYVIVGVDSGAVRELVSLLETLLKILHSDAFFVQDVLRRST